MLRRFRRDRSDSTLDAPDRELLDRADQRDRRIIEQALPYTMTGIPRMLALIDAVRYLEHRKLPGAFAECGVWRGAVPISRSRPAV